jgi:hypothetical protein
MCPCLYVCMYVRTCEHVSVCHRSPANFPCSIASDSSARQTVLQKVTVVLEWRQGYVTVVLQWCCSGVTVITHRSPASLPCSIASNSSADKSSVVTVVSQWCYSGVTVVLQWCYSGVTVV